jgi:lysine 2,3-aminomutase
MAITPYYASLMDPENPDCPIRRQAIPHVDELTSYPGMQQDPLAEERHSPVPGLVHRYPDRVLVYLSHNCPVYCRHCTRKRKVGDPGSTPTRVELADAVAYVEAHPEVRDVLLSGGDPLTLSDGVLDKVIGSFLAIRHVDLVRLGTRNPVTLPQRITPELCAMLRKHRPVYVHTHFNHPLECTAEAARALEMLSDAGCVLGNQMVLMKGINDDARVVEDLNRWLLRHRCKPYYILQCDLAPGVAHFRTHTSVGRKLISELRGHITGLGIPHYVVDLPGGGGKVPMVPNYTIAEGPSTTVFRNFKGAVYPFHEVEKG